MLMYSGRTKFLIIVSHVGAPMICCSFCI